MQSWVTRCIKAILISENLERQLSKAEVGLLLAGPLLLLWLSVVPMALLALWASENALALLAQFC